MGEGRSTRERIFEAAEALFTARGPGATSMRQITAMAKVNLAAINYHFGSKAALVEDVFAARVGPLNEERVRRLDALEMRGPPSVKAILEAFMSPSLEMLSSPDERTRLFMRMLARSHADELAGLGRVMDRLYRPMLDRYKAALAVALPRVPTAELHWRLHFATGALSYAMAGRDSIGVIGAAAAIEPNSLGRRILPFLAAGMETRDGGIGSS